MQPFVQSYAAVHLADPALSVGQAVDHHAAARRDARAARELEIVLVRVRDVERTVEAAVRDASVDP